MYLSFYGLREWPFALTSDTRFFYESQSHASARRILREGILARRGLMTLTGVVGIGKTCLLDVLCEELKSQVLFAHIPDPRHLESNLLEVLADQFGLSRNPDSRASLPTLFHRLLLERHRQGQISVLFVDKADEMDSSLLASLCLLTHHEEEGARLLQVILSGSTDLERRLRRLPGYVPIPQEKRAQLQPLTQEETAAFIQVRLRRAGGRRSPFSNEALERIYDLTEGNPRAINQLCDSILLEGYETGRSEITGLDVQRAVGEGSTQDESASRVYPMIVVHPVSPSRPNITTLFEQLAGQPSFSNDLPEFRETALETRPPQDVEKVEAGSLACATSASQELESVKAASLVTTSGRVRGENRWMMALFGLLLAIIGGIYLLRYYLSPVVPATSQARMTSLVNTTFVGKFYPAQEWKIVSPQISTVRSLSIKLGDQVQVGQVLMVLDDTEARRMVELARIECDQARMERDQAELEKKIPQTKKAEVAAVTGEVALAQRRAESVPVPQRQDSVARARIVFDQAKLRLERYERLYREGLISRDRYEEQLTAYNLAQSDLQSAEAATTAQARLLDAQRHHKEEAIKHAVQEDAAEMRRRVATALTAAQRLEHAETQLKLAEQRLADCTVRATSDGYVIGLPVGIGDQVAIGSPLVTLAHLDTLIVRVSVSAQLIDVLQVGDSAQVTLPTIPTQTISGKVIARNPVPEADGTHRVEVEIVRPQNVLLVGQPAEVRFR